MDDADWLKFFEQAKKATAEGKFGYAETSWSAALQEAETFGPTDERLVKTLEGQSETFCLQGKFRQAERPCFQVLEIFRKLHGDTHVKSGFAAHNLANVYHMQQKYGQAEPLYKLALSVKTKELGETHPDVGKLRDSYIDLLIKTNRQPEADKIKSPVAQPAAAVAAEKPGGTGQLFRNKAISAESLAGLAEEKQPAEVEKNSIQADEELWEDLKNRAEKFLATGHKNESLDLWNQAINLAERFPSQEKLSYSLDRIGDIMFSTEKYGQAEMAWWRSLQIKLAAIGEVHPAVAYTANKLAGLHYLLGRYSEAEAYTKKCRDIYTATTGKEHPNVATCLNNLASLYHVQGRYAEAEENYLGAMTIRRKILGTDHAETLAVTKNYAALLRTIGRDREAADLDKETSGLITGSWKAISVDADSLLGGRNLDD